MSQPFCAGVLIAISIGVLSTVADDENDSESFCYQKSFSLAPSIDSPDQRKYAPDREIDILNLALDITPDFQRRTIAGKAILTFKVIAKPLAELRLDAVDLSIQSVEASERIGNY